MNSGIEKITEKILADARADAEKILAEAKSEADGITAAAQSRAQSLRDTYAAEVSRMKTESDARAESAAELEERNAALCARAGLISRVFEEAHKRISALDDEHAYAFLCSLLKKVLAERSDASQANAQSGDDYDAVERYELILNARDRERFGRKLVDECAPLASCELVLSDRNADIDGGFLLAWGAIEVNCSTALLVSRAEESMEREVCDILYPKNA